MSIDVNVQNDLVIVTESSEDITVNVSNAAGPAGVGVPSGGSTGQVLKKASATNYDTYWAVEGGGVPYSGATGNVDLGEYELKAGQVEFDQTPTGTAGVGVMRWNDADGTVDLGLKGGSVTLQIGQEQVQRVVNKSGGDLLESAYQVVKVTSAQGQRLAVDLAQGNNDANSADTLGIVTETIANNQEGFITTSGIVRGINTTGSLQGETWVDGDVLYLSPTTAGKITNVKPTAPQHTVILGYVVYAHGVNGKIFVKCDNGYELGELHNVYVPTPSNNDGIFWNTANSRYQNNTIAGVLGYTPLSGNGVTGQVAYWNGTNSQTGSNNLFWDAANSRLGIGTNAPAAAYKLDVVGAIRASTYLLTPAIYSSGSLDFGVAGGTVGMTMVSATRNIKMWSGGSEPADAGQRLQVYGDAFIKGSGATSATIGLTVQDSAGTAVFRAFNDGSILARTSVFAGVSASSTLGYASANPTDGSTSPITSNSDISLRLSDFRFAANAGYSFWFASLQYSNLTYISGVGGLVNIPRGYAPTSGTGVFNAMILQNVINQTGGANGITRGLYVNPTLTAAADWRSIEWSNNTGWGLYGAGTANNYIGGALGINSTSLTGYSLSVSKNITGATSSFGIHQRGVVQTDVTSNSYSIISTARTAAAAFTLGNFYHYYSEQQSLGAGSAITNQYGYFVDSSLTSASNNYGFYGNIPNAANRWNLYMNGTADNYLAGKLLIGTTTVGTFALDVVGTARMTGNLTAASIIKSGGTSSQILAADGSVITAGTNITISGGTISASGGGGSTSPAGSNTEIQYNNNGSFGASPNFVYNSSGGLFITPSNSDIYAAAISIIQSTGANAGGTYYIKNSANNVFLGGFGTAANDIRFANYVSTGKLLFYANGSDRMTLTAAGRLLLGTTTESTYLLDVNGTARVSGDARINNLTIGRGNGSIETNTALGQGALENVTNIQNTAVGYYAARALTNSVFNTAIGAYALESAQTYNQATAIGRYSLRNITTGGKVTAIGEESGLWVAVSGGTNCTDASDSIFIGYRTGPLANSQSNQIVIGHDVYGLGSNTTTIGNSSTTLTSLRGSTIINGTSINSSAVLQADSTTRGFLPPRMTTTQKNAISTPAAGLMVFDTTLAKLCVYSGTAWETITSI